MVEVNDHKIHIYSEGNSKETLVFMSGSGTTSPYFFFKPFFKILSKKYRIVVIEKLGYGFSDDGGHN